MIGYLKKEVMTQAMLNQGRTSLVYIFCVLVFSCSRNGTDNTNYLIEISKAKIGLEDYNRIYNSAIDSTRTWTINKLGYYQFCGVTKNCMLDSLICFNSNNSRFITCILKQQLLKDGVADDIDYFYGEKINGNWFFFSGPNIFIPREIIKGHDIHTPLSYQQLHQMALKEVFGGYLKNGKINEAWFTSHFEHIGWGDFNRQEYDDWCFKGKRYTDISEYYKATHLCKVRSNWASRDTTKPIIPLPPKNLP